METTKERAKGRWKDILVAMGVAPDVLSGKHTACPLCKDGKDRFRFDDKDGNGTFICSKCGAGDGVTFAIRLLDTTVSATFKEIEKHIPTARVAAPSAAVTEESKSEAMQTLWRSGRLLNGEDPASLYLRRRGIQPDVWPIELRWVDRLGYLHDDKTKTYHPAMLARFVAADGKQAILHRTYLALDGRGKAGVPSPKKMMPGRIPMGGAVRLGQAGETLGIAEGIETALAAAQLFKMPVWAATSASMMARWQPPKGVKVTIFGDLDSSFTGQMTAYCLAFNLRAKGVDVEVQFPECDKPDQDFADTVDLAGAG
jgi:putative DNA primase/helicase